MRAEFEHRVGSGARFVLPITTLIETGNHIAKAAGNRRAAAERFVRMIKQIAQGTAPWRLNTVKWDASLLRAFIDGDNTGQSAVDLLGSARIGAGDLAIRVERDDFVRRTAYTASDVQVWSLDSVLAAYG